MGSNFFAVFCTAEISNERLNTFLTSTYDHSNGVNCDASLILVTDSDILKSTPTQATEPPVEHFTFPFTNAEASLGKLLQETVQDWHIINGTFFAVLDERSVSEDTALLVQYTDGEVQTVRAAFEAVNGELIRLSVMTFDIGETQDLARGMEDGVFRSVPFEAPEAGTLAATEENGAPDGSQDLADNMSQPVNSRVPGRRYFETEDGDTVMLLGTGEGRNFEGTQLFGNGKYRKIVREL